MYIYIYVYFMRIIYTYIRTYVFVNIVCYEVFYVKLHISCFRKKRLACSSLPAWCKCARLLDVQRPQDKDKPKKPGASSNQEVGRVLGLSGEGVQGL